MNKTLRYQCMKFVFRLLLLPGWIFVSKYYGKDWKLILVIVFTSVVSYAAGQYE